MALSISRRSFMKCLGLTAAASASGALMTGCAQGPVTGDFGIPASLIEDSAEPLLDVTLTGLEWSPFDTSLSEIDSKLREKGISLDLPAIDIDFSVISSVLGLGCAMPKGIIENQSDKMLVVLPYFTDDLLNQVFNEFVYPNITSDERKEDIRNALESYLARPEVEEAISNAIHNLIINEASNIGDWLVTILEFLNNPDIKDAVMAIFPESTLRNFLENTGFEGFTIPGLPAIPPFFPGTPATEIPGFPPIPQWPSSAQEPILNGVRSLIVENIPKATDIFRLLMVQGLFDNKTGDSKTDQLLNAAAAGFSFLRAQSPLMLDIIDGHSSVSGVLALPASRSWHSARLMFSTRKVNVSLADTYQFKWDQVSDLIVEAIIYVFHGGTDRFAAPLVDIIMDLLPSLSFSIDEVGGQVGLSFQNTAALF